LTAKILKRNLGFTLVELLIVIGLLGAIALIVIAAINPIEQANRARDTRFKADGAQLISAIDRYFAARQEFPWVSADLPVGIGNDDSFGFVTASENGVGLCGTDCTKANAGELLESDELKTEFINRDFVQNGGPTGAVSEKLFVGKAEGTSESIYACYIPASKSERANAIDNERVYHLNALTGTTESGSAACTLDTWGDDDLATGCFVCIPE
jgi:prepilin-type N-terminal cleavage/methylation domain-containing protein